MKLSEYRVIKKLIEEWLLSITIIGLIISSLYLKRFPVYTYNDFKVVYTLFVFLVLIKGLEKSGFLYSIASSFFGGEGLYLKLILSTAFLSIFVTNDIALLTVIPLTLSLNVEDKKSLIIMETITANGASALTPFGNPQNIFIYYYYHLCPLEFIKAIAPFTFIFLFFVLLIAPKKVKNMKKTKITENFNKKSYIYVIFFLLFILSVLKILPIEIGIIPIIYAILFDKDILFIDYLLLATFLCFFGFTDNLIHIFSFSLENSRQVFLYSAFASQAISNVPSALFFADFTSNWKALLWGVSVGGFGNLIGSFASLISYRLYRAKFPNSKGFLIKFHLYSYLAFFLGIAVYFLINIK